jgi:lysophospholipase L1-like esterase
MRRLFPTSFVLALALSLMVSGYSQPASSAQSTPPASLGSASKQPLRGFIAANDARFRYEGRVDSSLSDGVGLIWQATRVAIDTEGNKLALVFAKAEGANFFDLRVDDQTAVIEVPAGNDRVVGFPLPLGLGRHHVTLFKRSEAHAGFVVFAGLQLADNAQAWASSKPPAALKFEFFGDSITVGACNEDGAVDQWESRRTHNSARSYAALTAAAFGAGYRNISVSGMGVVTGYVDIQAPLIWDRLYPSAASPRADLTQWAPNVVFINYGENDTSFTQNNNQQFPPTFADAYVSLVQAIRAAYPQAEIVLLRGGMGGGAENLPLRAAWTSAVSRLEAKDAEITHFVFTHFSVLHPRVADHQAMADELIAWFRKQKFAPSVNR